MRWGFRWRKYLAERCVVDETEQHLIDRALAAGRVTHCPTGATTIKEAEFEFDGEINRLRLKGTKK